MDIPELTSCFPQTQNATAMCVCAVVSHATPSPHGRLRHLNPSMRAPFSHICSTVCVIFQKDANWKTHGCYAVCRASRSSLWLYNMHWNVAHNCKLSAPTSASCISCETESNISCLHASWHVPNGGKNKNKKTSTTFTDFWFVTFF